MVRRLTGSKGSLTLLLNNDGLRLELEDGASGVTIHVDAGMEETMALLSRQGHVECTVHWPTRLDLIGKKREVKRVLLDRTWDEYRPTHEMVLKACEDQGFLKDGWELCNDGTRSQQNERGKHHVVLERYLDNEQVQES